MFYDKNYTRKHVGLGGKSDHRTKFCVSGTKFFSKNFFYKKVQKMGVFRVPKSSHFCRSSGYCGAYAENMGNIGVSWMTYLDVKIVVEHEYDVEEAL